MAGFASSTKRRVFASSTKRRVFARVRARRDPHRSEPGPAAAGLPPRVVQQLARHSSCSGEGRRGRCYEVSGSTPKRCVISPTAPAGPTPPDRVRQVRRAVTRPPCMPCLALAQAFRGSFVSELRRGLNGSCSHLVESAKMGETDSGGTRRQGAGRGRSDRAVRRGVATHAVYLGTRAVSGLRELRAGARVEPEQVPQGATGRGLDSDGVGGHKWTGVVGSWSGHADKYCRVTVSF
jgi:hypothetical protein